MDTVRVHPEQSSLSHTREMFLEQECISRAAVERRIDPQRQQRVEYFVGLTFERSLVEEAFRSHPEMDDDDMLAVLMRRASSTSQRLRPISIPRQRADPIASSPSSSSSGGAAGGGSGGSSSSHHDPAMLRPVVIDGSNVAMRYVAACSQTKTLHSCVCVCVCVCVRACVWVHLIEFVLSRDGWGLLDVE